MNNMHDTEAVDVEDAVGMVLMHDLTRIVPGKEKGPAFRKGHIISEKDVPLLKDLGKERIYVFSIPTDEYHEDDAAERFKVYAGENVSVTGPSEGKVIFRSETPGLILICKDRVREINTVGGIALTTIHSNTIVTRGEAVAGARIIPLTIKKEKVDRAIEVAGGPLIGISPFRKLDVSLIVTGSEVSSGRIKDGFRPVIEKKIAAYNSELSDFRTVRDNSDEIRDAIVRSAASGCGLIIITGGMSVDPDDITPAASLDAGVEIVSYGAPVLPGNMFMVGYLGDTAVFGVPACALFFDITVLDLYLPYVFAGEKITEEDILGRGYGGYCRHCEVCNFPRCGLGKC